MELKQNLSMNLKAIRTYRQRTLTEFAEDLEISRSHLQELLSERANPRIDTVEHVAKKLGVSPVALLCSPLEDVQLKAMYHLLGLTETMGSLQPEKRLELARQFLQMVELWRTET